MTVLAAAVGIALVPLSHVRAKEREVVAHCSLVVDGEKVWNGKCCVTASTEPPELHAESWQACLYGRKHPQNASLPTFKQTCLGPWIDIFEEHDESAKGSNFSAYWSVKNACHGGMTFPARKAGNVYQGDTFVFEWH